MSYVSRASGFLLQCSVSIPITGVLLLTSHHYEFVTSIANRIVEICLGNVIDRSQSFDDYLSDKQVSTLREQYYYDHVIAKI